MRTSPPEARGLALAPPRLAAPPPQPGRGRKQQGRAPATQTVNTTAREYAPPSSPPPPLLGVDSGRLGVVQVRTPRPLTSPSTGVAGWSGRTGPSFTPPRQAAAPSPGSLPHGPALYKEVCTQLHLQPFLKRTFSPCMRDASPPALDLGSYSATKPAVMRYPSPAA